MLQSGGLHLNSIWSFRLQDLSMHMTRDYYPPTVHPEVWYYIICQLAHWQRMRTTDSCSHIRLISPFALHTTWLSIIMFFSAISSPPPLSPLSSHHYTTWQSCCCHSPSITLVWPMTIGNTSRFCKQNSIRCACLATCFAVIILT